MTPEELRDDIRTLAVAHAIKEDLTLREAYRQIIGNIMYIGSEDDLHAVDLIEGARKVFLNEWANHYNGHMAETPANSI